MRTVLPALALVVAAACLAACGSVAKQPPFIVMAYADAEGPHVQTHVDGTATVGLVGAQAGAAVDRVLDAKGNTVKVADHCGRQTAISLHASGTGSASAGGTSANGGPGVGSDHSLGFDAGEAASLEALADYQAKAGPTINAIHEWANCSTQTAPSQTAADNATAAAAAARIGQ